MVYQICITELKLNKASSSDTEAPSLEKKSNIIISTKSRKASIAL